MQILTNTYYSLKEIFSNWKYTFVAVISTFIFYSISSFLFQIQYATVDSLTNTDFILLGLYHFATKTIFITSLIISILTGILIALLTYRYDSNKKFSKAKIGFLSSIGIFLGVAAPGCASCGVGLAVALGLGSTMAKLPFHGTEISFVAIALLIYSITKISNSFYNCKI